MPLFYSQTIDVNCRGAIWKIEEDESFFAQEVPLGREIQHPAKRLQHYAGRYLLWYLFPDFPLKLIRVAATKKPFIPDDPFHFNISHCGSYAAAIVSNNRQVGLDIEVPTERIFGIQHKMTTPQETEALRIPGMAMDEKTFITLIWSAKEALYKWYGLGKLDFREHLKLYRINPVNLTSGLIEAAIVKERFIPLTIYFRLWPEMVHCYIV